jgi:hypothetical protein
MPKFWSFLEKNCKQHIQDQSTLPICNEETPESVRGNIGDAFIWVAVDHVDPPKDTAPEKIPLLKYAPVTSCDAEISFSAYKHVLSDKR